MSVIKKVIQGSYISVEAKHAFLREAYRQKSYPTRIVSDILEKAAQKIIKKEKKEKDEQS